MAFLNLAKRRLLCNFSLLLVTWAAIILFAVIGASPFCLSPSPALPVDHHNHHDHRDLGHGHHHHKDPVYSQTRSRKLPEELAEEEDLAQEGFGFHQHQHDRQHRHHRHHHHHHHHYQHDSHHHQHHFDDGHGSGISPLGIWIRAMGCSLLVSMASLICLTILPLIFIHGKPARGVVDCLAVFGAGAMLGDAFLHQLPHAFGGEHSHSHDYHIGGFDDTDYAHGHSHSHSLEDLSIGLSMLFGIVLFFLVEKIVRYVEDNSSKGANDLHLGHHHYHNRQQKQNHDGEDTNRKLFCSEGSEQLDDSSEKELNDQPNARLKNEKLDKQENLRKRTVINAVTTDDGNDINSKTFQAIQRKQSLNETVSVHPSNLVFGYLNLFSDGVHNFTDGMALGSAFLLHGSVGGWSRTLFLLAHELPQEIGDFGILVRSGFSVSNAIFFNFLSALVALAGTSLALVIGKDPRQSSLIEGFTVGGFIYIAVAGVLPEMHDGKTTVRGTIIQLASLLLGMTLSLCISLIE